MFVVRQAEHDFAWLEQLHDLQVQAEPAARQPAHR